MMAVLGVAGGILITWFWGGVTAPDIGQQILETLRPERERLAAEAATVPVLREALSELKAEREHWQLLATDLMQRRRRWWPWRRAG
jgi:hypothetical protein